MNAPGKTMLKVSSIILIVLGSLGVLGSACGGCSLLLVDSLPIEQYMEQLPQSTIANWNLVKSSITPMIVTGLIVGAIINLLELIFGIIGLRNCGKPEKGALFIGMGTALIVLMAIYMVLSFNIITLFSLALPVLLIVGGMMKKKAMDAAESAEPVQ